MTSLHMDAATKRDQMVAIWRAVGELLKTSARVRVDVRPYESTRSLEQSAKLSAMCGEIAAQVVWHGNKLSKDDWRHVFVAAYRREQRVVPGIDGGFVVLGASSRKLKVAECADVIEMIACFGAEHDVVFGGDK